MDFRQVAGSGVLWAVCSIVILAVAVQTLIFMRRGWKEATALGVASQTLKRTVGASVMLSIFPSVSIILILFAMVPLLGMPFPWLRLSIIGSAPMEMLGATWGVQALGEDIASQAISATAFAAAIWVCTCGCTASTLVTTLILKPCTLIYDKVSKGSVDKLVKIGMLCMAGVICTVFVQFCTNVRNTVDAAGVVTKVSKVPLVVGLFTVVLSYGIALLVRQRPNLQRLNDYNLAISMIYGMVLGLILGNATGL